MNTLKRALLIVLALLGVLLVWGLVEPYFIDQAEYQVTIPNLPENWDGQQVAVIADLQIGMWLDNSWTVRRIVNRLLEERPASVLIAGDFVYHPGKNPSSVIAEAASLVKPLADAGIPTYAVLGNHDYSMPTEEASKDAALASEVRSALQRAGVRVLQNESVPFPSPQEDLQQNQPPLYLVGIGAHIPDEDKPKVALAQLPEGAPRLVMMHHPESFPLFPKDSAPLGVAGHTHGGQFRLPFTPEWSWMSFTREDEVHADGWIENYGKAGNRLYINRGIGFSVLPLRLNCPPELTVFTLIREEGS